MKTGKEATQINLQENLFLKTVDILKDYVLTFFVIEKDEGMGEI